jgi:predicted porin
VAWARGPFYVFAAWEEHKDQAGGSATGTPPFPAGTGQVESGRNEEGIAIGGSWVIGPVKIGGQYQEFEKSANLLRWNDRKSWMGNVVWTLGNHQLIYQYQQSEGGGLSTLATQPECDVNSIAWQYNFSRRTFTQLIYNKIDNNSTANCGAAPFSAAVVPAGTDPQGISLGLRHIF